MAPMLAARASAAGTEPTAGGACGAAAAGVTQAVVPAASVANAGRDATAWAHLFRTGVTTRFLRGISQTLRMMLRRYNTARIPNHKPTKATAKAREAFTGEAHGRKTQREYASCSETLA